MALFKSVNSSPYKNTKRQPLKLRSSVEDVREAIRKEFRDRLKQLRNESFNGKRNLTDDSVNLEIFNRDIRVESSGLTSADVLHILEEVEGELQRDLVASEGDQYEQDTNAVMEDFLRGMHVCPVCDRIVNQSAGDTDTICDQCSDSFNA